MGKKENLPPKEELTLGERLIIQPTFIHGHGGVTTLFRQINELVERTRDLGRISFLFGSSLQVCGYPILDLFSQGEAKVFVDLKLDLGDLDDPETEELIEFLADYPIAGVTVTKGVTKGNVKQLRSSLPNSKILLWEKKQATWTEIRHNAGAVDGYITEGGLNSSEMLIWARDKSKGRMDIITTISPFHSGPRQAFNAGADQVIMPILVDNVAKASKVIHKTVEELMTISIN